MPQAATVNLTAGEYLDWEARQTDKYEFVAGEVFALVGVTRKHATVAGNLFNLLYTHLGDGPCRAYLSDMKLRIEAADAFFYPDVFVTCDPRDHRADTFMSSAVLVIEVLSPSTAAYDRGERFASYRKLDGLREFLLIDPDRKQMECFRRDEHDHWVLHEPDSDNTLLLESVDLRIAHGQVFRQVD